MKRYPLPILTIVVFIVTAIVTALQFVYPGVIPALQRDPAALAAGQWWRLVTPLLIQPEGWAQIITNFLGIAIMGVTVERLAGKTRWLALYLAAGITGHTIGHLWQPYGGGASVGVCGLIGATLVWLLRRQPKPPLPATLYAAYFVASLTGTALGGLALIVALVIVGVVLSILMRQPNRVWLERFVFAVGVVGALSLTALRDIHGPALLVGLGLAAILFWRTNATRLSANRF